MAEKILNERIEKSLKMAKDKKILYKVSFSDFYFGYYLPHERIDLINDIKFSYLEVFDKLKDMGKVREESMIWWVPLA